MSIKYILNNIRSWILFRVKPQKSILGLAKIPEVFDFLDSKCKEDNINYYLNLGKSRYIDLQVVHPSNFSDVSEFGYTIYLSGLINEEDSKETINLKKHSSIMTQLKDVSRDEFRAYIFESKEVNEIIQMTINILSKVFEYRLNERVYYDVNIIQ